MKKESRSSYHKDRLLFNHKGITLIELLIGMAMAGIVVSAIYSAYKSQLSSHVTQQQIVDMQQSIRGALAIMEQDIRLAGWPSDGTADAGILNADSDDITIAMDIRSCDDCPDGEPDGDVNDAQETIRYYLLEETSGDHVGRRNLVRQAGAQPPQILATNMDAMVFAYSDTEGNVLNQQTDADGNVTYQDVDNVDLDDIRTVQVTLIAKNGQHEAVMARKHDDDREYKIGDVTILDKSGNLSDQHRRIMLSSTIVCQNL